MSDQGLRLRLRQVVYEKSISEGRDISQTEIAEIADIRQPTVSKWMDNKRLVQMLDVEVLIRLAKALDVHPTELIEFVGVDWLEDSEVSEEEPSLLAAS